MYLNARYSPISVDGVNTYLEFFPSSATETDVAPLGQTGQYAVECYQETATTSTACGGLSTGSYSVIGVASPGNFYDGDYGTYAEPDGAPASAEYYVTYTIPSRAQSAQFQYKFYNNSASPDYTTINLTIPSRCLYTTLQMRIHMEEGIGVNAHAVYCMNSTGWEVQNNVTPYLGYNFYRIFEEGVWWNMSPYTPFWNITASSQNHTTDIYTNYYQTPYTAEGGSDELPSCMTLDADTEDGSTTLSGDGQQVLDITIAEAAASTQKGIWNFLTLSACTEGTAIDFVINSLCDTCVQTHDFDEWSGVY